MEHTYRSFAGEPVTLARFALVRTQPAGNDRLELVELPAPEPVSYLAVIELTNAAGAIVQTRTYQTWHEDSDADPAQAAADRAIAWLHTDEAPADGPFAWSRVERVTVYAFTGSPRAFRGKRTAEWTADPE